MAQDAAKEVKVNTTTYGVELNIKIEKTVKENTVARVYKFKNTRIKKELKFQTKRNNSKIA